MGSRFRIGDAVVVVDHPTLKSEGHRKYIGQPGVITDITLPTVPIPGSEHILRHHVDSTDGYQFYEEHLRLRRPPAWDSWLTDTSSVRDEGDLPVANKTVRA